MTTSEASPYKVYLGDAIDVMKTLPDKSIDHVITDPPYGDNVHKNQFGPEGGIDARPSMLDFDPITFRLMLDILSQARRVAKRWTLAFTQAELVGDWKIASSHAGLEWKRTCVWIKYGARPQLSGDRPGQGFENIICVHEGKSRWNSHGKLGIYEHASPRGKQRLHPTAKPTSLMEELVCDFTDPGDTILDPFCGSGTTGVACLRWGRNFLGIENMSKYHLVAEKRLAEEVKQRSLLSPSPGLKQIDLIPRSASPVALGGAETLTASEDR